MSDDNTQDWPDSSQPEESAPPPPAPPPPAPDPGRPPIPAAGGTSGSPGSLGQRFLARLIDGVLLFVVQGVIITPIVVAVAVSDGSDAPGMFTTGFSFAFLLISILSIGVQFAYYGWFDSTKGQTLGKMAMKLKVLGPQGGNPTFAESVQRNAWIALSIIPFLGGLVQLGVVIWIAVTINSAPDGRGPHDGWAGGTQVVVA